MEQQLLARIEILFAQQRYNDAEELLLGYLEQYPDFEYAQYLLAVVNLSMNEVEKSRAIIEPLIQENPEKLEYLSLSARIDIVQELYAKADEKCELLIGMEPEEPDFYNLMANSKFRQRNYDQALFFSEKALSLDPEDLTALNLKSTINGILGQNEEANLTITEALQQDPNNDWTIANHGRQMLNEGKVKDALERFKESLHINPNNSLAQYGLTEALKSRFWPYKMFYQFQRLMSRMSSNQMWGIIIIAFFLMRFIRNVAEQNPELGKFLMPIVYLIVIVFLSTWILTPLMNLYLLTNRYGKLLLDDDDKKSAKYVGISLMLAILSFVVFLIWRVVGFDIIALFFVAMMIPLGSMFNPPKPKDKRNMFLFTLGILIIGILGILLYLTTQNLYGLMAAFGGIFIYQWILNAVMIKAGARVKN